MRSGSRNLAGHQNPFFLSCSANSKSSSGVAGSGVGTVEIQTHTIVSIELRFHLLDVSSSVSSRPVIETDADAEGVGRNCEDRE